MKKISLMLVILFVFSMALPTFAFARPGNPSKKSTTSTCTVSGLLIPPGDPRYDATKCGHLFSPGGFYPSKNNPNDPCVDTSGKVIRPTDSRFDPKCKGFFAGQNDDTSGKKSTKSTNNNKPNNQPKYNPNNYNSNTTSNTYHQQNQGVNNKNKKQPTIPNKMMTISQAIEIIKNSPREYTFIDDFLENYHADGAPDTQHKSINNSGKIEIGR